MRTRDYDKLARLKAAMIHLVLREGMSGASVAKIAREAGVSPATVYVYYSSKEEMLAEVFRECAGASYRTLLPLLESRLSGADFLETLIRGFFDYSVSHLEAFSFVEQCSRCPSLLETVSEEECCCEIFERIHAYQLRGEMRPFSDLGLSAVLFAPIRFLALKQGACQEDTGAALSEFIAMMQHLLLY